MSDTLSTLTPPCASCGQPTTRSAVHGGRTCPDGCGPASYTHTEPEEARRFRVATASRIARDAQAEMRRLARGRQSNASRRAYALAEARLGHALAGMNPAPRVYPSSRPGYAD